MALDVRKCMIYLQTPSPQTGPGCDAHYWTRLGNFHLKIGDDHLDLCFACLKALKQELNSVPL